MDVQPLLDSGDGDLHGQQHLVHSAHVDNAIQIENGNVVGVDMSDMAAINDKQRQEAWAMDGAGWARAHHGQVVANEVGVNSSHRPHGQAVGDWRHEV